jgi:hypothetical protein
MAPCPNSCGFSITLSQRLYEITGVEKEEVICPGNNDE